jgi:general secretion pathway protein C
MNEKQFIKLFWLVKALLILVLVCVGFRAITGHLQPGTFVPAVVSGDECPTEVEPEFIPSESPADYAVILRKNLFGGSDNAVGPGTGDPAQAIDAMPSAEELGLRLVGAIAGGPTISRANIQNTKTNTTGVYRIGDTVASARVEAIQQDAVVLQCDGQQFVLRLNTGVKDDKDPAAGAEPQTVEKPVPTGNRTPLPAVKADYISEVFRKATIEPVVKNGRTQGLQITGLDKIPMAELFGLKNGDIIRSVNGQQLSSKQKAFQVLMKAKAQSKVDIQLLRNGKSKDLSFDR